MPIAKRRTMQIFVSLDPNPQPKSGHEKSLTANREALSKLYRSGLNQTCRPGSDLLSHALRHSTIGAEGLNGRVRNGNGWDPLAITTQSARLIQFY